MISTQPLLSRVADSVYWMTRYVERAENIARYIGVNLNLQLDLPSLPHQQWQPLVNTTGDAEYFKEHYGEATQDSVIKFLVYDANYGSSVRSCLRAARENARSVRETISPGMWEQINAMYLRAQVATDQPEPEYLLDSLREISLSCQLLYGIAGATMSRGEAWHFLNLGRMLERADKTSRILDVKYFMLLPSVRDIGTPYDDIHWAAVLKSVSGFEMYRQKYGRISPENVVAFLVMDREFPRSLLYCVGEANEALHRVTGVPMDSYRYRSEQLLGRLESDLNFGRVEEILSKGLHEYLDTMQSHFNDVDNAIRSDFLSRQEPQTQVQTGGNGSAS